MNRDEILAMEPGRELDALVARKVMGWMQSWSPSGKCEAWFERQDDGSMRGKHDIGWNPSKSISAAWEVVEKITKKAEEEGGGPIVELTHDGDWHAKIGKLRAMARTAPEAICKAALQLAVMEE